MKNNLTKTIKSAIALCFCALTVILSFCSCSLEKKDANEGNENIVQAEKVGKGKSIDLKDYVTVDYISSVPTVETVYSSLAEANLTVDYALLTEDINIKKVIKYCQDAFEMDAESAEAYSKSFSADQFFTIKLKEEYKELANGDFVTIEAVPSSQVEYYDQSIEDIAKGLGISFEKESQIEVTGLTLAKEIDLFVGIEDIVRFKGTNGTGEIYFEIPEDYSVKADDFYLTRDDYSKDEINIVLNGKRIESYSFSSWTYAEDGSVTLRKDWSKGEAVTIYASKRAKHSLAELGYVAKTYEYEGITVPDLGTPISAANQLSQSDIEQIKKAVYDRASEDNRNVELISGYFGTIKPDEIYTESEKYCFTVIFSCSGFMGTRHGDCDLKILARYDTGELKIETDYAYAFNKTAEETKADLSDKYTYEQVF